MGFWSVRLDLGQVPVPGAVPKGQCRVREVAGDSAFPVWDWRKPGKFIVLMCFASGTWFDGLPKFSSCNFFSLLLKAIDAKCLLGLPSWIYVKSKKKENQKVGFLCSEICYRIWETSYQSPTIFVCFFTNLDDWMHRISTLDQYTLCSCTVWSVLRYQSTV